ncbi:hypothetical protein CAEBREN_10594 [Caenorhabditis brenneri]|uniref:Serpentine receptor class gamma n=1 Tax=Caenorhabditis brenneri TaxID=135651 RepID=G0N4R1_CAEBE|nr:hypothetical protein CAEBREN_10594 [Caenorhabditis brenneri]
MLAGYVLQLIGALYYIATLSVVYNISVTNKVSAPFYKIFFVIGLMDVTNLFALMWMDFEKSVIKGQMFVGMTYACSFLTCFCFLAHIIGNGLMAINRFAAVFDLYRKVEKVHQQCYTFSFQLFTPLLTKVYLCIVIALALFSSVLALFRQRVYSVVDGEWTFTLEPQWLIDVQRFIIIGWMAVYLPLAVILTWWAHYRIKNMYNTKSDITLLYFVMGHIVCHSLVFIYELVEVFHWDNVCIAFIHENFYVFLFIAIAMNSVTLTYTTASVRQGLSKLLCRVVKYSRGKVSSSQQTLPVFNVSNISERY